MRLPVACGHERRRTRLRPGEPHLDRRRREAGRRPARDALNRGFERAAARDAQVARWWLDLAGCSVLPSDLLSRPAVVDRVVELGQDFPEPAGPARQELLELVNR